MTMADLPSRDEPVIPRKITKIFEEGFIQDVYLSQLTNEACQREASRRSEGKKMTLNAGGEMVFKSDDGHHAEAEQALELNSMGQSFTNLCRGMSRFFVPLGEGRPSAKVVVKAFRALYDDLMARNKDEETFVAVKLYLAEVLRNFVTLRGRLDPSKWDEDRWRSCKEQAKEGRKAMTGQSYQAKGQRGSSRGGRGGSFGNYSASAGPSTYVAQAGGSQAGPSTAPRGRGRGGGSTRGRGRGGAPSGGSKRCVCCGGVGHGPATCDGRPDAICVYHPYPDGPNGRWRNKLNGREYCNSYNYGSCIKPACQGTVFLHECSLCGGAGHCAQNCTKVV